MTDYEKLRQICEAAKDDTNLPGAQWVEALQLFHRTFTPDRVGRMMKLLVYEMEDEDRDEPRQRFDAIMREMAVD